MGKTKSKKNSLNSFTKLIALVLLACTSILVATVSGQGVILTGKSSLTIEPGFMSPEWNQGEVAVTGSKQSSDLQMRVHTFSGYEYMIVSLMGEDSRTGLRVRIIDTKSYMPLMEEAIDGDSLTISTETLPQGRYIAKLMRENEILHRQSFVVVSF